MVFLTQMVPCLHVYPRMRALANQEVSGWGVRSISAESAASEKKRGPYNRLIAIATQHLMPSLMPVTHHG